MFARHGISDELISDNGPQLASGEFAKFAKASNFTDTTSSPRHPQSNGNAENSIKSIKKLFKKAKEAGISEAQVPLDFRNTPTEGITSSPAQRLFGRRCKTLLVSTSAFLPPRYSLNSDYQALRAKKEREGIAYDQHARRTTSRRTDVAPWCAPVNTAHVPIGAG